jgi:hypothetical protein
MRFIILCQFTSMLITKLPSDLILLFQKYMSEKTLLFFLSISKQLNTLKTKVIFETPTLYYEGLNELFYFSQLNVSYLVANKSVLIPEGVKYIYMNTKLNSPQPLVIPKSAKKLYFCTPLTEKIQTKGISSNMLDLELPVGCTFRLVKGVERLLPRSIKNLNVGLTCNAPLSIDRLPKIPLKLTFDTYCNMPSNSENLPPFLEILTLGSKYEQEISTNVFSESLIRLNLGPDYTCPISKEMFTKPSRTINFEEASDYPTKDEDMSCLMKKILLSI